MKINVINSTARIKKIIESDNRIVTLIVKISKNDLNVRNNLRIDDLIVIATYFYVRCILIRNDWNEKKNINVIIMKFAPVSAAKNTKLRIIAEKG